MKRHFVTKLSCTEGSSDKFYNIELLENRLYLHYGRNGTTGILKEENFHNYEAAEIRFNELYRSKIGKGYRETERKEIIADITNEIVEQVTNSQEQIKLHSLYKLLTK